MRRLLPFLAILICGAVLGATRATEPYDLKLLDAEFRLLGFHLGLQHVGRIRLSNVGEAIGNLHRLLDQAAQVAAQIQYLLCGQGFDV